MLANNLSTRYAKQFGICVDSTHGTNMYDFFLITVLVVDESVAWMISRS